MPFVTALFLFIVLISHPARSLAEGCAVDPAGTCVVRPPLGQVDVLTYHYDSLRTGWNPGEDKLTAANVGGGSFGLLFPPVALDDQVDAQPLLVANQTIDGQVGTHQVVYVVTENDSVYAIDARSGKILKQVSLGSPVEESNLPGKCNNNADHVGITSTPVIDLATSTLYVIGYTWENNQPVYRVHALDLSSLADKITSVPIDGAHGASHVMPNGRTYGFNPATQRQRAALLQANGNIYAAFSSFCDFAENQSRGWVLGWRAGTLAPLAANELTNRLLNQTVDCPYNNDNPPCYLTSIWMSGYGMAADSSGNIFAVTGNGGPGTFDGNYAIQESVVELGAELKSVESLFTPSDSDTHDVGVNDMDSKDGDLGSGGVMLLPDQPGSIPHLAVVQGKIGPMYLLNRDKRGRYRTEDAVAELSSDWGCWCGPSYFASSDGGFVVSSTGTTLAIWKVQTSPTVNLIKQSAYAKLTSVQDRGFMTSVSSHDGLASSTVVWAVPHAATWNKSNPSPNLTLYAFSAADASNPIFQAPAGYWLNLNGNANVVPVVANGKVFVASYRTLAVFGLDGYASLGPAPPLVRVRDLQEHEIYGRVESVSGHQITVRTRSGDLVRVDTTIAASGHHLAFHGVGGAVSVRGNYDASGVLAAQSISRAKSSPGAWEPDR